MDVLERYKQKYQVCEYIPTLKEYHPSIEAGRVEAELLRLAKLGKEVETICKDCEDDLRHKDLLEVCAICRFKSLRREVKP
jgi:hypothetical protein